MKIIKRNGDIVAFDKNKILNAITKANNDLKEDKVRDSLVQTVSEYVSDIISLKNKDISVEEIQDLVEVSLMKFGCYELAQSYIRFRHSKNLAREAKKRHREVLELLDGTNEYWNTENSNKNPKVLNVQRDYMAGILSKEISEMYLIPKDVLEAHKQGIIHFHDIDYFGQNASHNCELINLKDMLENGTVMNGVKIDPQHRLSTACTVATQIITAVSSSSYGGATITLTHLAPFVRMSEQEIRKEVEDEVDIMLETISDDWGFNYQKTVDKIVEKRLKKEIRDSVQTFNYQINSMTNTNGQAPFLSVFMYISEDKEYEKETAMLIEEFLHQRILGMKNEVGVYVTPAFPKLIYCLDENNIIEDSKYWYLTELSAKCTAKRLVPDYISAKKMRELKGDVYPCINKTCAF